LDEQTTRLIKLHSLYYTNEFYQDNLDPIISPLILSIHSDGGVPLKINEKNAPVYTSTTATCLLALHYINTLSSGLKAKMHSKILELKDKAAGNRQVIKKKAQEDESAWCITEEASVWSTALALWGLISTGYNGDRLEEIKQAVLWLIRQQKFDNGWAFQNISTCPSRVYFTSIVLHVLKKSKKLKILSKDEIRLIDGAISRGIEFIISQAQQNKKQIFWSTSTEDKNPDATNTSFAIWALHKADKHKHKELIEKGIYFLKQNLGKQKVWDFACIASEVETKYGLHKTIYSFTPAIVIILLQIGVHPFDELILKPITFLKRAKSRKGWGIKPNEEFTFSTALALWTIHLWHKYTLKLAIQQAITARKRQPLKNYIYLLASIYSILKSKRKRWLVYFCSAFAMSFGILWGFLEPIGAFGAGEWFNKIGWIGYVSLAFTSLVIATIVTGLTIFRDVKARISFSP